MTQRELICCLALAIAAAGSPSRAIDSVPLAFTASAQPDSEVRFSAYGRGMSVELTRDTAILLQGRTALPIRVVGASRAAEPAGVEALPGKSNFFFGSDPKHWRTGVATYGKVAYRRVLPGVDLVYYGNDKRLEYDFELSPGADPSAIVVEVGPGWSARIGAGGRLELKSSRGAGFEFHAPVSYQPGDRGERVAVASRYRLLGARRFGFHVGAYDRSRKLVIDPVLVYGTYLGGSSYDAARDVAIDSAGNAYVTGYTQSTNFPTVSALNADCGSGNPPVCSSLISGNRRSYAVAFVTKFNPQGTQVIYSTYLGGPAIADTINGAAEFGGTLGTAIAVDSAGNAYVAGQTQSLSFPVTAGAFQSTKAKRIQTTWPGPCAAPQILDTDSNLFLYDAFVTKLDASGGALVYSTYLGGTGQDSATGITVTTAGEAFVVGSTHSRKGGSLNYTGCSFDQGLYAEFGFPTTANAAYPEVIDRRSGVRLGFLTKFTAGGAIAYSTYIGTGRPSSDPNDGKEGHIDAYRVAVDGTGAAYVAGSTEDLFFAGGCNNCSAATKRNDAFLVKINPAGTIGYGPKLYGGSSRDYAYGVAIDASFNAYIAGVSGTPKNEATVVEFPTTTGAYQTTRQNSINNTCPFVVKASPTGTTLYSTFVCGNARDASAYGIAVDPELQTPVITGRFDDRLPLVNNISFNAPTGTGVYLARLNSTGTGLLFSSFIGVPSGQNDNESYGNAVVLDGQRNAWVAGSAGNATGTLATPGAYDTTPNGVLDGFVSRVDMSAPDGSPLDFRGIGRSDTFLYDPVAGNAYAGLSNGSGGFTYAYTPFLTGFDTLRTGNFNADGKADLIVYNSVNAAGYLGLGNGNGTFTFQSLFWSPGFNHVNTGDLNGDGRTDLVLYRSSDGTMYTALSNGAGGFTYKYALVSIGFTAVKVADFTGDGKSDLLLYRTSDGLSYLGTSAGNGSFTFAPVSPGLAFDSVQTGDINGDGKIDVLFYAAFNGVARTAVSTGTDFTYGTQYYSPNFTAVRLLDLNGDGKSDIVLYNKTNALGYFGIGSGAGTFTFGSLFWGPGMDNVEPYNLNSDGKADLVLYNSATGTAYTALGNGSGVFTYAYSYWGPGKILAR